MKFAQVLAPVRILVATLCLGLAFVAHATLSFHYYSTARGVAQENLQLKEQIRGLVERMVDVEAEMGQLSQARETLDAISLGAFETVVDRTGLDPSTRGPFAVAVATDAVEATPRARNAPSSFYAGLLDRLATARHEAGRLAEALGGTADGINRRQEIIRSLPSIMPAKGYVSSEFGPRESPFHPGSERQHNGMDIAAAEGTPVVATADGVVSFAGNHGGFGKLVSIDHGFGIVTKYAHNAELLVKKGQRVTRGEIIASIGSTGRSTGIHVHYEVLIHDKPVDPRRFLFEAKPEDMTPAPETPVAPALLAMGGETAVDAPTDMLVDMPKRLGIEWDAPVFRHANQGVVFAKIPAAWRDATAGDLVVLTLALVLLAIACIAMRLPTLALRVRSEDETDEGEELSAAELIRQFQRKNRPSSAKVSPAFKRMAQRAWMVMVSITRR